MRKLLFIALVLFVASCANQDDATKVRVTPYHYSFEIGVGATPATTDDAVQSDPFLVADDISDLVMIKRPFNYVDFQSDEIPERLRIQTEKNNKALSDELDLSVYYAMDSIRQRTAIGTIVGDDFSDSAVQDTFKRGALFYADLYEPSYMALAVDVNHYYDRNRADFRVFVDLYKETYDLIKAKHPETKVFVTFDYERMQGLTGFGTQWGLVDMFDGYLDMFAITSHPAGVASESPHSMPDDYFTSLADRLPVLVETAWSSSSFNYGSNQNQIAYFEYVIEQAEEIEIPVVIWSSLYDTDYVSLLGEQGVSEEYSLHLTEIGLVSVHGDKKPIYQRWSQLR